MIIFKPRFVQNYADVYTHILNATQNYIKDVKTEIFPAEKHTFYMDKNEYNKLKERLS